MPSDRRMIDGVEHIVKVRLRGPAHEREVLMHPVGTGNDKQAAVDAHAKATGEPPP